MPFKPVDPRVFPSRSRYTNGKVMDDVLVLAPGFDFLGYGYHFRSRVFEQAEATIDRFVGQATRFYEQGRRELV
jgi:hypothetical protein